jgi:glycine cleavage system aminomethyltransferase T
MIQIRTVVARTPLHHWHAAHGARFADQAGWQVVTGYGDPQREAEAAHTGLALSDISAFAKVSLRGPGVAASVQSLAPDSPALRVLGVATLSSGNALACRLTEDHLLCLGCAPGSVGLPQPPVDPGIVQTDMTSALAGIQLLGSRLEEFLARLTHLDVRLTSFRPGSCAETALAGVEALLVRPAGTATPRVDIYASWDLCEFVWERMLECGRPWSITAVAPLPFRPSELV